MFRIAEDSELGTACLDALGDELAAAGRPRASDEALAVATSIRACEAGQAPWAVEGRDALVQRARDLVAAGRLRDLMNPYLLRVNQAGGEAVALGGADALEGIAAVERLVQPGVTEVLYDAPDDPEASGAVRLRLRNLVFRVEGEPDTSKAPLPCLDLEISCRELWTCGFSCTTLSAAPVAGCDIDALEAFATDPANLELLEAARTANALAAEAATAEEEAEPPDTSAQPGAGGLVVEANDEDLAWTGSPPNACERYRHVAGCDCAMASGPGKRTPDRPRRVSQPPDVRKGRRYDLPPVHTGLPDVAFKAPWPARHDLDGDGSPDAVSLLAGGGKGTVVNFIEGILTGLAAGFSQGGWAGAIAGAVAGAAAKALCSPARACGGTHVCGFFNGLGSHSVGFQWHAIDFSRGSPPADGVLDLPAAAAASGFVTYADYSVPTGCDWWEGEKVEYDYTLRDSAGKRLDGPFQGTCFGTANTVYLRHYSRQNLRRVLASKGWKGSEIRVPGRTSHDEERQRLAWRLRRITRSLFPSKLQSLRSAARTASPARPNPRMLLTTGALDPGAQALVKAWLGWQEALHRTNGWWKWTLRDKAAVLADLAQGAVHEQLRKQVDKTFQQMIHEQAWFEERYLWDYATHYLHLVGYTCIEDDRCRSRYNTLPGETNPAVALVKTGQWVDQGEAVGYMDSTGISVIEHLHYQIEAPEVAYTQCSTNDDGETECRNEFYLRFGYDIKEVRRHESPGSPFARAVREAYVRAADQVAFIFAFYEDKLRVPVTFHVKGIVPGAVNRGVWRRETVRIKHDRGPRRQGDSYMKLVNGRFGGSITVPVRMAEYPTYVLGKKAEGACIQSQNSSDPASRDTDRDGWPDALDNCPKTFNPLQERTGSGRAGDACQDDTDGDGVKNADDNCPFRRNPKVPGPPPARTPEQPDKDGDGVGDACDDDIDDDGLLNAVDPCPLYRNTTDTDGDGVHDACDPDLDDDGVPNGRDLAPLDPAIGADQDRDGLRDWQQDPCPCSPDLRCTKDYDWCANGHRCPPPRTRPPVAARPVEPTGAAWEQAATAAEATADMRFLREQHRKEVVDLLRSVPSAQPPDPAAVPEH